MQAKFAHPATLSPDTRSLPTYPALSRESAASIGRKLLVWAYAVAAIVGLAYASARALDNADLAARACGGHAVGLAYVECAR